MTIDYHGKEQMNRHGFVYGRVAVTAAVTAKGMKVLQLPITFAASLGLLLKILFAKISIKDADRSMKAKGRYE